MKNIQVSVERRQGPTEETYMQQYEVPLENGMSVLNVLDYISRHCDPTLSYEASCRRGLCAVCVVNVDGKVVKSCMALAHDDLTVKTGSKNPVKDLTFSNQKLKKDGR